MNKQNPIYRGLLFIEVVVAYAYPVIALLFGTVVGIAWVAASLMHMRFEVLPLLLLLIGGYMGMIGVLNQVNFLLGEGERVLGWKTFLFTLVGCLAVVPFTYVMLDSGKLIGTIAGLAPILVAVQLTFMNRAQLLALFKTKKGP